MSEINLYFDGYCPESLLKGKQVEMRLNADDFWESVETGLQIVVSPPYAVILRWRGIGKFRQSSPNASDSLVGLVLVMANEEKDLEIFPDEECIIHHAFDLEWYLSEIYLDRASIKASQFNPDDPCFEKQRNYLDTLTKTDFSTLFHLYDKVSAFGFQDNFMRISAFSEFHEELYKLKIPFDFNWSSWHTGWRNIGNQEFNYSGLSLMEYSMYITAILRSDRFNEGTIQSNFENGTLPRIFSSLKAFINNYSRVGEN